MSAKRIVICLDGTWNNTYAEEKRFDGIKVIKPSNVLKLARAVLPKTSDLNKAQIVFYDTGVGAMSEFPGPSNKMLKIVDNVLGGGWGAGFESNIEDAITFLAYNYQVDDQVYIFGFSRGASTARGLTQFIDWMGGIPVKRDVYYVPFFLRRYLETKGAVKVEVVVNEINNRRAQGKQKLYPFQPIMIELLGVWDSVMSLGSKLFTTAHRRFHISEKPARCIKHVRHALAVDEKRADFKPEIWKQAADDDQSLVQRWFAGVHSNIGGGYVQDGLANIAFRWMIAQAAECGIEFDDGFVKFYRPYPQDQLTESKSLKYKFLDGIRFRNGVRSLMGYPLSANLDLHYSVISRIESDANLLKPGKNQRAYPRLTPYEPHNVFEFLTSVDNLNDYLTRISLRDRGKKPSTEPSQKLLKQLQAV